VTQILKIDNFRRHATLIIAPTVDPVLESHEKSDPVPELPVPEKSDPELPEKSYPELPEKLDMDPK